MKKKLFLLAFCAIFSIIHGFAQDVQPIQTSKKSLKEGKNLLKATPTMKVYAEVQNKQVVRVYVIDSASTSEIEVEGVHVMAAPGTSGGGGIDMPPMCIECPCVKTDKKGKCIDVKCKTVKCRNTPQ
ncbi:MAG: hypothetical protein EPGJADBJ_00885 [Saprospiraceae bacterium]|nr:hypothetical protein [Saprospiraceae bacterium]